MARSVFAQDAIHHHPYGASIEVVSHGLKDRLHIEFAERRKREICEWCTASCTGSFFFTYGENSERWPRGSPVERRSSLRWRFALEEDLILFRLRWC